MPIGTRIKLLRKALKLTQEEFAGRMRISKGFVSNLEKDRVQPSGQLIHLMCYEYSSSEYWLTTGEGEMFLSAEEVIKQQMERLGKPEFYQALSNLQSDQVYTDQAVVVMESALAYRAEHDPELDAMIHFLKSLWMTGDKNLRAWAVVQFSRAFPDDIKEEVLKKSRTNNDQATG